MTNPPSLLTSPSLLIDIRDVAQMTRRSIASLGRDAAAGRLPAAIKIGRSTRWRRIDIISCIEMLCPSRAEFEARQKLDKGN
jgi:predicted DNA-binding transcriptional regulator AlpA